MRGLRLLIQICVMCTIYNTYESALVARAGMTSYKYQQTFNFYVKRGFRLIQVSGYAKKGIDYYAAIWVTRGGPAWVARHRMSSKGYQQQFNYWVGRGYRVVVVSGYQLRGVDYYAAIFEKRKHAKPWVARHGMDARWYQHYFNLYTGPKYKYRPTYISAYSIKGVDYYAAIWEKSDGRRWVARHRLSSKAYQFQFNLWTRRGYRLVIVSGYQRKHIEQYAAFWEKVRGPAWFARHGMSLASLQSQWDSSYPKGWRISHVSGYCVRHSIKYAAIWQKK